MKATVRCFLRHVDGTMRDLESLVIYIVALYVTMDARLKKAGGNPILTICYDEHGRVVFNMRVSGDAMPFKWYLFIFLEIQSTFICTFFKSSILRSLWEHMTQMLVSCMDVPLFHSHRHNHQLLLVNLDETNPLIAFYLEHVLEVKMTEIEAKT